MTKRRRKPSLRKTPPWQHLQNAVFNGDANDPLHQAIINEPGFVGVFKNNLYQVTMKEFESDFGLMTWLVIRRLDSEAVHDWRHLQRIKNELCGPESEAVEIYPAESRLVDTANQYHLFVFPRGTKVPFGYTQRAVSDFAFGKNKNRPFDIVPKDLNADLPDGMTLEKAAELVGGYGKVTK